MLANRKILPVGKARVEGGYQVAIGLRPCKNLGVRPDPQPNVLYVEYFPCRLAGPKGFPECDWDAFIEQDSDGHPSSSPG